MNRLYTLQKHLADGVSGAQIQPVLGLLRCVSGCRSVLLWLARPEEVPFASLHKGAVGAPPARDCAPLTEV